MNNYKVKYSLPQQFQQISIWMDGNYVAVLIFFFLKKTRKCRFEFQMNRKNRRKALIS